MQKICTLILCLSVSSVIHAQSSDGFASAFNPFNILKAGEKDAPKLLSAYFSPLIKGYGIGLTYGFGTSARFSKGYKFSIGLNSTVLIGPSSGRTFDVNALGLEYTEVAAGEETSISPTIFGPLQKGVKVVSSVDDPNNPGEKIQVAKFNLPPGIGGSVIPVFVPQLSFSLPKQRLEFIARYFPKADLNPNSDAKSTLDVIGFGFRHDPTVWFKNINNEKFATAISAGFTRMAVYSDINVKPDTMAKQTNGDYTSQFFEFGANSFNADVFADYNPVWWLTLSGSVGFAQALSSAALKGLYPFATYETKPGPEYGQKKIVDIQDPISLDFNPETIIRASAGFKVRYKILGRIFGFGLSYAFGKYQGISTNIGYSKEFFKKSGTTEDEEEEIDPLQEEIEEKEQEKQTLTPKK